MSASRVALWSVWLLVVEAPLVVAASAYYESEPNNTPVDANPIAGEVDLYGTMVSGDQDGFLWTVSDDDARKRWTFELTGIPGALTIAEIVRVEYTESGVEVAGIERLMKMGTRDGLTPSVHEDQLFDPGEYLIGIAYAGGPGDGGGGIYRPPVGGLSFGADGEPELAEAADGSAPAPAAPPDSPGAYRFRIYETGRLNVTPNAPSRATQAEARDIRPGQEFATFESREAAWYRIEFGTQHATQRWDIEVRAPIGRPLTARLIGADYQVLSSGKADAHGRIRFPDLAPGETTWYVHLDTPEPGFIHRVSSEAVGLRVAGGESEPNDKRELANRVDFAQPVNGRIGADDRYDHFLFQVGETDTDALKTLLVESASPAKLQLCLHDAAWVQVQCRDGTTPLSLPDLLLAPGSWGVVIQRRDQADYRLSLAAGGSLQPGTEVEPNDLLAHASSVPASHRINGRFHGDEPDHYQFLISESAQLWRFQVMGDGIQEVGYADGSGKEKFKRRVKPGERRVRLDDVFLLPGRHYLRVLGRDGGEYTLLARPVGPPDPDGELEPNDELNMQRLSVGQTRKGLLVDEEDRDFYRFFLGDWDHIRLTIQPPPDGVVDAFLYWYGFTLGDAQPGGPGEALTLEGLFPPGDYHVWLHAAKPSDAEYQLSLERLPRFSCPADCEPNGMKDIWLAAPIPPDLVLEGRTGDWRDRDDYQLPAFDAPTELLIQSADPVHSLSIGTQYGNRQAMRYDSALGGYGVTVPAGAPHRLMIDSRNEAYLLALDFPNGELEPVTGMMDAELAMTVEPSAVAAFRRDGQRVQGTVRIANTGEKPLEVALDAVTSDYRWQVSVSEPLARVPAGDTASIPLDVRVPADAWGERPVRISVVARDREGRQLETWAEIDTDANLPPVDPEPHWGMPESLRGGFNAAWSPFGAEWTEDTMKAVRASPYLRDGLVFPGARIETPGSFNAGVEAEKPVWTLELPGEDPVPVAGIAIDHFGTPGIFYDIREATLLLSLDGVNFEEVLRIEARSVETEQAFALPEPVPARFARLKIDGTFQESTVQRVFAGEWKVILEPGYDLSLGAGFNLADPDLGGHVVWDWPPRPYSPTAILSLEDDEPVERAHTPNSRTADYVIGFLQNRAAQITSVSWQYAPRSVENQRTFERVEVSVGVASSVGPWTPVGTLDLSDARETGTLVLEAPVWARYVRLTAHLKEGERIAAAPGVVRVTERPTDAQYRSVLTEWGETGSRAFFEEQAGLVAEPAIEARGNDTRANAALLSTGEPVRGYVSLGRREHWYRLQVPADRNLLSVTMNGDPTVRTVMTLQDGEGNAILSRRVDRRAETGRHRFEAVVEPGSEVYLQVSEPPRNVIFSWDTSASVLRYLPLIQNSLVAFSGQVVPGREAVNLMPFPRGPLLEQWYGEPYILQTVLNDYRRPSASSSAEYTLKLATQELSPLPGTKAIVVITDAQTPHDGQMWGALREVQPRIFGIGVGGAGMDDQHRFRDWADVNDGHYTQLRYEGEMEVAFDRAVALMHRPAGYTLRADTEYRSAPGPGFLSVIAGTSGQAGAAVSGTAVELILDASGSMLKRLDGRRRIAIAKEVLTEAVREHLPAGTPVALRVFGHREVDSCRTDLEIPLGPLDPDRAVRTIAGIEAMNLARTPIADSLKAVERDLEAAGGGMIVLVTDGEETCEGDPAAVLEALAERGFETSLNIVGFAIDDAELTGRFRAWAELGGGRYLAADDAAGLSEAIEAALRLPFVVYDQGGNQVALGQVGGEPVTLDQGIYRVVVRSRPQRTFDRVEVSGGTGVSVSLP